MRHLFNSALLLASAFTLMSCEEQAPVTPPPTEVFVISAEEHPYKPTRGFNARIDSRSDVKIQAQVSGKLVKIHFREGDSVKKGTPLFDIDAAPFTAVLAKTKAELAKAQAKKKNDERNFARGKGLVKDGFISESEFDTLEARKLESIAQVASAVAAVESAEVDLSYTKITAPQDGRVGRSEAAIGDIISPQSGTLTTLVGQNDMDVVFQIPERVLIAAQQPDSKTKTEDIVVGVQLSNDSEYAHTGSIDYFSNRVDLQTGTVEVRARIPNPDDVLRPGMFVRALLRLKTPLQGMMIPQSTVQVDQQGTYVFAVDKNNTVERKNLITGERINENVLVNSGLEAGSRVIIRGIQKVRPGDIVTATPYTPTAQ